ncbi:unnamed protein product [Blepharisma stoltei]|uniref:Uncharacterized protein n=1 Tax=Blepharisma stoltei TaxID=1481888 RepID=A0AAU9JUD0_9CILI|nr:unnamed protein product [Blepharisma stoltei]
MGNNIRNPQSFSSDCIQNSNLNSKPADTLFDNNIEEKSQNYKLPLYISQTVTNQTHCTDNSTSIISWKSNSKSACVFDSKTKTIYEQELKIPKNLSGNMICRIPDNKLFFYGNLPISGSAFILDSFYNITNLQEGKPAFGAGGVYYNGFVYIFGGCDYHDLFKASSRYSLSENRWSELMSLPVKSYYCSCEVFNGVILIYGYHHEVLYIYDPAIDIFTDVNVPFVRLAYKIIIKVNNRGYILDHGGTIYESLENDLFCWEKCRIGTINREGFNCSLRVECEGYIYYMISDELYQFSLKPIDIFLIDNKTY